MSVHRQVNRGPTGDGGLSPEAQQLLVYLAIGSFAAFMLIRVVYMMLYSLPLVGVLLFFTKPSLYGFRDFLAIVEKKKDGEQEADDPISGGNSGGNWLTSLVTKSIKGIKGAIFNPAHRWLYVDLLVIIVARKRQPKVGGGSGRKKYAIGVLQRWFLLEESSELPMLSYAYGLVDLLLGWLNDEQWASFAALPPPPAGSADAAAVPSIDPSRLINAANEIIGGEIDAMAQMLGTAQARAAEGNAGRRVGGSERPIQMFLDRAQAFAEAGNFERAGQSVEAGISRCRGSLKGSKCEEEGELWLVAAAFYEASGTQLSAVVKCLRQAADLCVAHGKWRDAARLFVRATEVWIKEKVADSNYAVIASSKAASLLLSGVLCELLAGDAVQAEAVFRSARLKDPDVLKTPEGELTSLVLTATSNHDSELIGQARRSFLLNTSGKTELESWQEGALQQISKRLDSGHLK